MQYDLIFTDGRGDDSEWTSKGLCCNVLIRDAGGRYYNPQYISLERLTNEFGADKELYLEDNLIVVHAVTRAVIVNSIQALHRWKFDQRWVPLSMDSLENYFALIRMGDYYCDRRIARG